MPLTSCEASRLVITISQSRNQEFSQPREWGERKSTRSSILSKEASFILFEATTEGLTEMSLNGFKTQISHLKLQSRDAVLSFFSRSICSPKGTLCRVAFRVHTAAQSKLLIFVKLKQYLSDRFMVCLSTLSNRPVPLVYRSMSGTFGHQNLHRNFI